MMKYLGGGFLVGVPSRDLTDEEVAQYGKRRLLDSGLYTEIKKSRKETQREAGLPPAEVNDDARY